MTGFDKTAFSQPLQAEEAAKQPATLKRWVSEKYTAIRCKFSQLCCGNK
jgi:hypothetical protein